MVPAESASPDARMVKPDSPPDEPEPPAARPAAPPGAVRESPWPRRLIGLVLVAVLAAFLALHVAMDQLTPYTSEATLEAPVIGIAPSVSGNIVTVAVRDNQRVKAGDLIFEIDPGPYKAVLQQAEAQLENVTMQIGAGNVGLGAAEAASVQAKARLADVEQQAARSEELFKRGYTTRAALDTARANLASAQASVTAAEAQLTEARTRLGPQGEDNPQVRAALAARERAQIDLMNTRVTAPVDGAMTNRVLSIGQFAGTGKPVATIVDTARAWVIAQLPENALGRIAQGDPVDIVLDVMPGQVLRGHVDSIASGVTHVIGAGVQGDLPTPVERRDWLRGAERFPVRIEFDTLGPEIPIRAGAGASIAIYTANAGQLADFTRFWMQGVSLIRYAF